ncbi:MAG: NUDIX hydrolase [Longicatena sp.]
MDLIEQLKAYVPYNEQEEADRKIMLEYLHDFQNVYERENHYGHITCSPWIVNKTNTKVLMIYHNIYDSWGWCGGHCDGDTDVMNVALKEGMEETGLKKLIPLQSSIFSIEILPVPPHKKKENFISSHVHLNVTFLCVADEESVLRIKADENSGVQWVELSQINQIVREEDMKPVYQKLVEKSITFFKDQNEHS